MADTEFRMTPSHLKWLRHLRDNGPTRREGFGNQPYHCARQGLAEWVDAKGNDFREQITDAGREALAEWEKDHG